MRLELQKKVGRSLDPARIERRFLKTPTRFLQLLTISKGWQGTQDASSGERGNPSVVLLSSYIEARQR